MSQIQTFRPRYELYPNMQAATGWFRHNNTYYYVKNVMFPRMTATQKDVLSWLLNAHRCDGLPMSISHGKTESPDKKIFYNQATYHVREIPYAMVDVTVHFAGDEKPKLLKVYFCNGESFNPDTKTFWTGKSVRISFVE